MLRYRCQVGHAMTAEAVLSAQASEAENMIERLLRVHEQRAALTRRLADRERMRGHHQSAERLAHRAHEYGADAEVIGQLLADRDNRGINN